MAEKEHHHELVRRWLRRKNFTILLFLLLYALAKIALYVDDHFNTFMPRELLVVIGGLPAIFITLFFANVAIRVASPFLSRFFKDEIEPEQRIFLVKAFEILVYTCAIAFILYSFGVTAGSLALIIGFISGGLAVAVRDPVLSFIVWLIILNKKPFRLGDTIRTGAYEGRVDRIGTLFLTLEPATRLGDDTRIARARVKIPNKMLFDSPIENLGQGDVTQLLRLQVRARPPSVEGLMADAKRTAESALKREGIEPHVDVGFDVQNVPQSDKHYLLVSFSSPVARKDKARMKVLTALCERHKRVLMQK